MTRNMGISRQTLNSVPQANHVDGVMARSGSDEAISETKVYGKDYLSLLAMTAIIQPSYPGKTELDEGWKGSKSIG